MKEKEYTLRLHWKQGSDFADELKKADTVPEALRSWAERFERNAEHCRELADEFDGEDVEADATVHHIGFYGDEEVLEKAAEKGLLEVTESAESESHGKARKG
ncbi:hypothetical protein AKJ64_02290 [candidate division MSBL1 archaeon SCGC-AAA259E17]|uniref:Uncharacterized protein n=1 Tax=candidate division MSBL1 archaeon SCGC-AAA259E17 TaxID=1698263 RepID=A0A133UEW7_9EURY|nr:hypothetical protein AKJ64_02290 [candidate division MSBL1 archaeon SCGC-AAA259E17]